MRKKRKATEAPPITILVPEVDAAAMLDLSPLTVARARRLGNLKVQRVVDGGRGRGRTYLYDPAYLSKWADENPVYICPPLIRENRAAIILGCSVQTVARLRKTGKLPAVTKGRKVGYRYDDLMAVKNRREQGQLDELDEFVMQNL